MGSLFRRRGAMAPALEPLTHRSFEQVLRRRRVQTMAATSRGEPIVLCCAKGLETQAAMVLDVVRREVEEISQTRHPHGSIVRVGPTEITLRASAGVLRCFEPDYLGPDPLGPALTEDLTVTCLLYDHQLKVAARADVLAFDSPLFGMVVVADGALPQEIVFLRRKRPQFDGHTGWFLMGLEHGDAEPIYKRMGSYLLLKARPSLLVPMALPRDYIVRLHNDTVAEILDPHDAPVYRA